MLDHEEPLPHIRLMIKLSKLQDDQRGVVMRRRDGCRTVCLSNSRDVTGPALGRLISWSQSPRRARRNPPIPEARVLSLAFCSGLQDDPLGTERLNVRTEGRYHAQEIQTKKETFEVDKSAICRERGH
jgi:hypothetical protein